MGQITRDEVQKEALVAYLNCTNRRGLIVLPTGVGKSRIGAYAAQRQKTDDPNKKSLVIVPTTTLRDKEWNNTFEKFKYSKDNVDIICVQSLSSIDITNYDKIIADEAHLYTGEQFSKFLDHDCPVLCLTATLKDSTRAFYAYHGVPVVYEKTVKECLDLGFITPFVLIQSPVDIHPLETDTYNQIQKTVETYSDKLIKKYGTVSVAFGRSGVNSKDINLYRQHVALRKDLLSTSISKIDKVIDIIAQESGKIIIFGESIGMIKQLSDAIESSSLIKRDVFKYHSKMKIKERNIHLDAFIASEDGIMISAKALKQGMDVPDCAVGIIVSRNSNPNDAVQQLGRIVRKCESKTQAKLYNVYVRNSKDEEWSRKALIDIKDCNEIYG